MPQGRDGRAGVEHQVLAQPRLGRRSEALQPAAGAQHRGERGEHGPGHFDQPRRRAQRAQHARDHLPVGQGLASGQVVAAAAGPGRGERRERRRGKIVDVHRLAQPGRAAREDEHPAPTGHGGDAAEAAIAAGAVHQGRAQDDRLRPPRARRCEQRLLRPHEPRGQFALGRIGRPALRRRAGGAECDHAAGLDAAAGVPAREQVQRAAAEHGVVAPGQLRERIESAPQPVQAAARRALFARGRVDLPARLQQPLEHRRSDLSAGPEQQRTRRRGKDATGAGAGPGRRSGIGMHGQRIGEPRHREQRRALVESPDCRAERGFPLQDQGHRCWN